MSEQHPEKDKAVVVPCQMLGVSEFDVSTLVPPAKLAGVHVGGLSVCETILETSEFDCSRGTALDAPATKNGLAEVAACADVRRSIRDIIEDIRRPLDALLAASAQGQAQGLALSALESFAYSSRLRRASCRRLRLARTIARGVSRRCSPVVVNTVPTSPSVSRATNPTLGRSGGHRAGGAVARQRRIGLRHRHLRAR